MLRTIPVVVILTWSWSANADDGAPTTSTGQVEAASEGTKQLALSVSLLRLAVARVGQVAVEYNFAGKMSAAAAIGGGPQTVDVRNMAGDFEAEDVLCISSAAQFRYYALGNFDRGLSVGADATFFYVDRDQENSVRPFHDGLWLGPEVGYKYTFDFGLVLSASVTGLLPLYRPDGIDEDELPGETAAHGPPHAGSVLFFPNGSVGWAL